MSGICKLYLGSGAFQQESEIPNYFHDANDKTLIQLRLRKYRN